MFHVLDEVLEWNAPQYEMIDKERIFSMFEKLTEREYSVFGSNDKIPEFEQY